jgi:hypothetical protein
MLTFCLFIIYVYFATLGTGESKEVELNTTVNNDSSMWRSLPVITFQKFDDITGCTNGLRSSISKITLPQILTSSLLTQLDIFENEPELIALNSSSFFLFYI